MPHRYAAALFERTLERAPASGYIVATGTTGSGIWVMVENATSIIGLLAACVGLFVGIWTLRVQARQLRKLEREEREKGG